MNIKIKAVGAYFTPAGIVADTATNPKYAQYDIKDTENTYELYVTSKLSPAAISVRIPVELSDGETVFMNGFQSETESRERTVDEKMRGADAVSAYANRIYTEAVGGDYSIVKYKNKAGVTHGFSYCYFRNGENYRFFGSLDESTGYTVFKYDANTKTLKISKDIEGVKYFDNYKAMAIFYAEGSEAEVFDKWFAALGETDRLPAPELIGYSTKKLSDIDEKLVLRKLSAVKKYFPIKANAYIIDGEYCVHGDWLNPDELKFPNGLRGIADKIKTSEMIAGLCLSPFTAEEDSEIFEKHKDWLLSMPNGRFVKAKKNLYVLDSENAEVRAYVREVIHTILYMWGFDMVKLDNLYVAGISCGEGKSRGERMCSAMRFLRECCGGKLMYADHTPLMPAFGLADYCAISCDAVASRMPEAYSKRFYRESASVRNAAADVVFRRSLDKRAFLAAPCEISFDEKEFFFDGNLNSAEQNVLTNISGLFTSVLVFLDSGAAYDQKKKRRFVRMCNLAKAKDVTVEKADSGFAIRYKLDGRSYVIKFR